MNARKLALTAAAILSVVSFNTFAASVEINYPSAQQVVTTQSRQAVQNDAANGAAAKTGDLIAVEQTSTTEKTARAEVRKLAIESRDAMQHMAGLVETSYIN